MASFYAPSKVIKTEDVAPGAAFRPYVFDMDSPVVEYVIVNPEGYSPQADAYLFSYLSSDYPFAELWRVDTRERRSLFGGPEKQKAIVWSDRYLDGAYDEFGTRLEEVESVDNLDLSWEELLMDTEMVDVLIERAQVELEVDRAEAEEHVLEAHAHEVYEEALYLDIANLEHERLHARNPLLARAQWLSWASPQTGTEEIAVRLRDEDGQAAQQAQALGLRAFHFPSFRFQKRRKRGARSVPRTLVFVERDQFQPFLVWQDMLLEAGFEGFEEIRPPGSVGARTVGAEVQHLGDARLLAPLQTRGLKNKLLR